MAKLNPQKKIDIIASELVGLKPGQLDDFSLRKKKRETEEILKIDPSNAHAVLGIIYGLEINVKKMIHHFDLSIKLSPTNTNAWYNYATSLKILGFYSEAVEKYKKCYQLQKGNKRVLRSLIGTTFGSGRWSDALSLVDDMNKISPNEQQLQNQEIANISNVLRKFKINDDDFESIQKLAFNILHDNNIYYIKPPIIEVLEDEFSKWINYRIRIDTDVDTIVSLSMQLADNLASGVIHENVSNHITIMFSCA